MGWGTWGRCSQLNYGCWLQDLSGFLRFSKKTTRTARKSVSYLENWETVAARVSTGRIQRQVALWKRRGNLLENYGGH